MSSAIECLLEGSLAVVVPETDSIMARSNTFDTMSSLASPRSNSSLLEKSTRGVDSDDDSDTDDEEDELSWRLNPRKSLSDWRVEVTVQGNHDASKEVYHVHKSVLAVGPRRSLHFAAAFSSQLASSSTLTTPHGAAHPQNGDWLATAASSASSSTVQSSVDAAKCVSQLTVHALAAAAFPFLLDYMYTGDLDITTANAVALYNLAAELEIKTLRKKVKDFWTRDLSMENLCTYYQHARVFQEKRLLTFAEDYCAHHIFLINETVVVEILSTVDPFFFLRVVTLPDIGSGSDASTTSLRLSLLIAVYCNIHKAELDKSMFLRLTAATHLPQLEIKAARALLEIEDEILCEARTKMSSLKHRCIHVLSEHWDVACNVQVDEDDNLPDKVTLPRLTGEPLETFVSLSLINAKKRLLSSAASASSSQSPQLDSATERRLEDMQQRLDDMQQLQAEKEALERQNRELQHQLEAARVELDQVQQATMATNTIRQTPSYMSHSKTKADSAWVKE